MLWLVLLMIPSHNLGRVEGVVYWVDSSVVTVSFFYLSTIDLHHDGLRYILIPVSMWQYSI